MFLGTATTIAKQAAQAFSDQDVTHRQSTTDYSSGIEDMNSHFTTMHDTDYRLVHSQPNFRRFGKSATLENYTLVKSLGSLQSKLKVLNL